MCATTWQNLKNFMLSEKSQGKKDYNLWDLIFVKYYTGKPPEIKQKQIRGCLRLGWKWRKTTKAYEGYFGGNTKLGCDNYKIVNFQRFTELYTLKRVNFML